MQHILWNCLDHSQVSLARRMYFTMSTKQNNIMLPKMYPCSFIISFSSNELLDALSLSPSESSLQQWWLSSHIQYASASSSIQDIIGNKKNPTTFLLWKCEPNNKIHKILTLQRTLNLNSKIQTKESVLLPTISLRPHPIKKNMLGQPDGSLVNLHIVWSYVRASRMCRF